MTLVGLGGHDLFTLSLKQTQAVKGYTESTHRHCWALTVCGHCAEHEIGFSKARARGRERRQRWPRQAASARKYTSGSRQFVPAKASRMHKARM